MSEHIKNKIILTIFALLVLYGTYIESMKQYELYQFHRDLLEHGTIVKAEDFYRTGEGGHGLGYTYKDLETGETHTGATFGMTNVRDIIKQDSIRIVYKKYTDTYDDIYYDELLREMTLRYIIIQSLFYVILVLSVLIPVWLMKWSLLRRKLQLLREINAKLERGEKL